MPQDSGPAGAGAFVPGQGAQPPGPPVLSTRPRVLHGTTPALRGPATMVILVCLALFASFIYLTDRAGTAVASPAAAFVPPDGHAWIDQEQVSEDGASWVRTLATESARLSGPAAVQSLDGALGEGVLEMLGLEQIQTGHFWRTTATLINHGQHRDDVQPREQQQVRLYRTGAEVAIVAESDASLAMIYDPPLVVLPQTIEPGHTWQGSGRTSIGFTYHSSLTLQPADAQDAAGEQDCVVVSGTIEYRLGIPDAGVAREVTHTWCPGEGQVQVVESVEGSDLAQERLSADLGPLPPASPETAEHAWGEPATWQEQTLPARSHHGALGTAALPGVTTAVPPVLTDSGHLVRVSRSQDLIAFTADGEGNLEARWWAHPGGDVLRLVAAGDSLIATTSGRQVVGYSDAGVRHWTASTADLVLTEPAMLGKATVAVVTVSGDVLALDVATGAQRWRTQVGSDVGADPVAAGGLVLVGTRTGWVIALDARDGQEVWRTEMPSSLTMAALGEVLVVAGYTSLTGVDLREGTALWTTPLAGRVRANATTGQHLVLATDDLTFAVDATGRQHWSRAGSSRIVTDGTHLALLESDGVAVLTIDGHQVAHHSVRGSAAGTSHLFSTPVGVALTADLWDLRMWQP